MIFEWDSTKAARSLRKHDVSFHEAATVFADPLAYTFDDPNHSEVEERSLTFGMSAGGRLLVIIHTSRGETIRIISAREMTRNEWRIYEENEGC